MGAVKPRSEPLEQRSGSRAKHMGFEVINGGSGAKIEAAGVKMGSSEAKIGCFKTQIGAFKPQLLAP